MSQQQQQQIAGSPHWLIPHERQPIKASANDAVADVMSHLRRAVSLFIQQKNTPKTVALYLLIKQRRRFQSWDSGTLETKLLAALV